VSPEMMAAPVSVLVSLNEGTYTSNNTTAKDSQVSQVSGSSSEVAALAPAQTVDSSNVEL
jgi:hypothetical protein